MKIFYGFSLLLLASCTVKPYATNNKAYTKKAKSYAKQIAVKPAGLVLPDSITTSEQPVGAISFNLRKPNLVVLHHTAQNSCNQTLQTFTNEKREVSAHYLICKDGIVFPLLNDYLRGWHAGAGSWGSVTDVNSSSIGVEVDNNGFDPFSLSQIESLKKLLLYLKKTYNIPAQNFIAHSDLAPGRKVDPNKYFPWEMLAKEGIGVWYDTTGLVLPANFEVAPALKIIGYSVKDLNATIASFRLRFLGAESTGMLNDEEKKILYSLMLKMMAL